MHQRGSGAKQRKTGQRLARDVVPRRYDVRLEVDPEAGDAYRGEVRIEVALGAAQRRIELHAAELRIGRARIRDAAGETSARVELHPDRETVSLAPARPVGPGDATIELAFTGKLRTNLRGLYGARTAEHRYAFSQLEAADARRFLPCFDEPAMKARFRIAVTTRAAATVLSNAPIERTERHASGRKTVHFAETPPLSTYLVALAVGALESSVAARCGPTEIRVWHTPGKGKLTGVALEAARECLARLERWFALPYPYAKLDLVAVPDFEAGAMENAGAITYREVALLLDPKTAPAFSIAPASKSGTATRSSLVYG